MTCVIFWHLHPDLKQKVRTALTVQVRRKTS